MVVRIKLGAGAARRSVETLDRWHGAGPSFWLGAAQWPAGDVTTLSPHPTCTNIYPGLLSALDSGPVHSYPPLAEWDQALQFGLGGWADIECGLQPAAQ